MDLPFIELILWGGLVFFFWALKDGLGHAESEIDSSELFHSAKRNIFAGVRQERVEYIGKPIGSYQDVQIHPHVIIEGQIYEFDRVHPKHSSMPVGSDEGYLEPGLVYRKCKDIHIF
jgi:hypothetical protein